MNLTVIDCNEYFDTLKISKYTNNTLESEYCIYDVKKALNTGFAPALPINFQVSKIFNQTIFNCYSGISLNQNNYFD